MNINPTKTKDTFTIHAETEAENRTLRARVETLEEVERQLQRSNAELREEGERRKTGLEHALYAWGLVAESESPTEGDREEAAARIRKARAALKGETKGETI